MSIHYHAGDYITRHGLAIVAIPPGSKAPQHPGWNEPGGYYTDRIRSDDFFSIHPNHNIGAVLGPSGLVSLDIDHVESAALILSEFGVDIFALRDSCPTVQGHPERFRVMFRAPAGFDLPRHSITWPHRDGGKSYTVFELRGGAVQDVLPPSIHPDTRQPYQWLTPPGTVWPVIPDELLTIWRQWDIFKPQARRICPWSQPEPARIPAAAPQSPAHHQHGSVIEAYNREHGITAELERYGYRQAGKRYLSPHSSTKLPGVVLLDGNRCYIHHASDPLCSDESGRPVGPFDLYCEYEHGGDVKTAVKSLRAASVRPGMVPQPVHEPEYPDAPAPATEPEGPDLSGITGEITEDLLALLFEGQYRDRLRYCDEAGYWYGWTGTRWRQDRTRLALDLARRVCREHAGHLAKFQTARVAAAVEKFASASRNLAILQSSFDPDPWLIGTPGGTLDLRTGDIRPASQGDYMTRNTAITPADPGTRPARWLAFLDEATRGDAELMRFLQQVAGYCLTGDTSEESLFFLYGPGGNGKGVFVNTLTGILGGYSQPSTMETFTESRTDSHTTDLAMLNGARLVTASETEQGKAWAEARIKAMTGRDPITARFMRRDNFTYVPQFKILIMGNHKPRLKSVDESVRRRFFIIPFTVAPKTVDRGLKSALEAEWPAILRWAVDGCLDWQRHGLIRPDVVRRETDDYFSEQDIIGQWLEECCVFMPAARTATSTLFSDWEKYAQQANEYPGTTKVFSEILIKRGFQRYRTSMERGFEGLALNPMRPTCPAY